MIVSRYNPIRFITVFYIIQILMKYKGKEIDVNEEGDRGGTPLHCAAYYDHAQCAKILVSITL